MNDREYAFTAKDAGTIPNEEPSQHPVAGAPPGSFGFEIELPQATFVDGANGQTVNPAENAVALIQDLLETSLQGTDDDLAEVINRIHPRAAKKVAELLRLLRSNKAQVTIGMDGRYVALRTPDEVERANRRLAPDNIEQGIANESGTLTELVPAERSFHLRLSESGQLVKGRIGWEINDPHRIADRYTNREVTATVRWIRVGESQPKLTLLGIVE